MSSKTIALASDLRHYMIDNSEPEPEILARLREETQAMPRAGMQISPEQGRFMALLVELTGTKRALEVGTFTGYSALSVALALPADGELIACDVSGEWTSIGRRYWAEAGVADKIDLRLAPATETLEQLLADGQAGSFDFAFIDADKTNYGAYYEAAVELVRPGDLILVDNMLWQGYVVDPTMDEDESTLAIRELGARIREDARVTASLIPLGDGVMLARKR
jgi:predicted O-methyltransferase YrrM